LGADKYDLKINSVEDIHIYCAKIGLFPVRIEPDSMETISYYIQSIGVDTSQEAVIPLGYDYGCALGKCESFYHSFSSDNSPDLTNMMNQMLDRKNVLNQAFSIGNGQRDSFGLGMSKDKMLKFNLGDFPVSGIVCSTNDDPGMTKP